MVELFQWLKEWHSPSISTNTKNIKKPTKNSLVLNLKNWLLFVRLRHTRKKIVWGRRLCIPYHTFHWTQVLPSWIISAAFSLPVRKKNVWCQFPYRFLFILFNVQHCLKKLVQSCHEYFATLVIWMATLKW